MTDLIEDKVFNETNLKPYPGWRQSDNVDDRRSEIFVPDETRNKAHDGTYLRSDNPIVPETKLSKSVTSQEDIDKVVAVLRKTKSDVSQETLDMIVEDFKRWKAEKDKK